MRTRTAGIVRRVVMSALLAACVLPRAWGAGVPEAGITLYGKVWDDGSLVFSGNLTWTYTSQRRGRGTVEVTTALEQITATNGDTFSYRVQLPAESGVTGHTVSATVLEASASTVTYSRSATLDSAPLTIADNRVTDTFSLDERGKLERVDLAVSGGVIPSHSISGSIAYGGGQKGDVVVQAFTESTFGGTPAAGYTVGTAARSWNYSLTSLSAGGYYLRAFCDSDGNGSPGAAEAHGTFASNPVQLPPNATGVTIALTDPDTDFDGLPDWWELKYFGDLDETGGGNYDGDDFTNAEEYAAGMNPDAGLTTCAVTFHPKWNLVSMNVDPVDSAAATVLPLSQGITGIYEWFEDHYIKAETIVSGTGYWTYFNENSRAAVVLQIEGEEVTGNDLQLEEGWNLVGPNAAMPVPGDAGIIGTAWLWNAELQAYERVGEEGLEVGLGYWIYKVTAR